MPYKPKPIDTSHVKLDRSLRALVEKLARNVHDVWAQKRMAEGWTYGPKRDDEKKTNPTLVPYDDLPESEKEYDRQSALGTIKCVLSLGYRIEPRDGRRKSKPNASLVQLAEQLRSEPPADLTELHALWRSHELERWVRFPELYRLLAEQTISIGEPLLTYDVVTAGLELFTDPEDPGRYVDVRLLDRGRRRLCVRLRQLQGLALAQSGATSRARAVLKELRAQGQKDGETLGILARTYKDLGLRACTDQERLTQFRKALDIYRNAYEVAKRGRNADAALYNGINAATLSLLCGQKERAVSLAIDVRQICLRKARRFAAGKAKDDYWVYATLGEAALIQGRWNSAEKYYEKAAQLAGRHYRDVSSMRRQARLLAQHLVGDPHRLDRCFAVPEVVVFAGHIFDPGGRRDEQAGDEWEHSIRRAMADKLNAIGACIGYACVLSRPDIVFLEEMSARNMEVNVVLPWPSRSVQTALGKRLPDAGWEERFDQAVQRASSVTVLGKKTSTDILADLEFAYMFSDGVVALRAQQLDTHIRFVAFRHGRGDRVQSDTVSLAHYWTSQGRKIDWLDCREPGRSTEAARSHPAQADSPSFGERWRAEFPKEIRAMLFADVKSYSKIGERQVILFSHHFLEKIAEAAQAHQDHVVVAETAGDGIFLVFRDLVAAASCALDIRDKVASFDWETCGLPKEIGIRISLDAGPVHHYTDPIAQRNACCGDYVIRAARIEPITPPGHVYASQTFAALAASQGLKAAQFEYVGRVPLPKDFGTTPLYHVSRGSGTE